MFPVNRQRESPIHRSSKIINTCRNRGNNRNKWKNLTSNQSIVTRLYQSVITILCRWMKKRTGRRPLHWFLQKINTIRSPWTVRAAARTLQTKLRLLRKWNKNQLIPAACTLQTKLRLFRKRNKNQLTRETPSVERQNHGSRNHHFTRHTSDLKRKQDSTYYFWKFINVLLMRYLSIG